MPNSMASAGQMPGNSYSLTRRTFLGAASATAFTIMSSSLVRGTEANSKLEVGCIGLGARGRLICSLMAQHAGYRLVAAADYFPEVVRGAFESLKVPESRCYSGLLGYRRLIESKVDAVLLEAPPYCFPEHARNTHQFQCTASAYGRDGYIETSYTGTSFVRGNKGGYKGGPATNLYVEGIKRNLGTFYKNVTGGIYDNSTVEPSVNSTLVTILGREAGARNSLVTWDQLLRENKRVELDLKGLKE